MLKTLTILLGLILICFYGPQAASQNSSQHLGSFQIISQIRSTSYSEPISVYAWGDEWSGELKSGEQAYTKNSASLIVQSRSGIRYGIRNRYDYNLKFSEETARYYYDNERSKIDNLDPIPIYLKAQHLSASGILLGLQTQPKDNLLVRVDLTRLRAHDLIEGDISGRLRIVDGRPELDGDLDYAYQEDKLLDRPALAATLGWGWALDLGLDWQINDDWHLNLEVQDAFSEIKWKSVPYTQINANVSDQFEDGRRVKFEPVLSGIEGERTETQRLPIYTQATFTYDWLERYQLNIQLQDNPIEPQFGLGWTRLLKPGYRFGTQAIFPVDALGVFLATPIFSLNLTSDAVSIRRARWVKLDLNFSFRF